MGCALAFEAVSAAACPAASAVHHLSMTALRAREYLELEQLHSVPPERDSALSQPYPGLHGHSGPQMRKVLPLIENDSDGQPLHDLDVVAGRVFRREQLVKRASRA